MIEVCRERIVHPGVWTGATITKDDIAFDLAPRQTADLDAALAAVQAAGTPRERIGAAEFPLPALTADLARMAHELRDGRGLVLLRGIPVERYAPAEVETLYWGLGAQFGRPVSQSVKGDLIGHVTDASRDDPHVRPYRARNELRLHTDFADLAALLCVRPATSGGVNRLVSTLAVHNEILATRPDLLEVLYRGYHWHRLGEEGPTEGRISEHRLPHYGYTDGYVGCRYSRAYIVEAAEEAGAPLTPEEIAALDYFDSIAYRPDMQLEFRLEAGEALFMNSYTTLHTRTAFEDHPDPARKRLLLRLWLAAHDPRPVVPRMWLYGGELNGIPPRADRDARFVRVASADWMS